MLFSPNASLIEQEQERRNVARINSPPAVRQRRKESFKSVDSITQNAFKQREAYRKSVLAAEKQERNYKKAEKDFKYRNFDRVRAKTYQKIAAVERALDQTYGRANAAGTRLARSFSGVRPRVRGDNLSRQVLEDSFRLDTDIIRRQEK